MKLQRVLLLMVLSAPVYLQGLCQSTIGRQKVDQFPTTAWNTLTYGLTWLPTDYDSTTTKYPLILFLHGSGEGGDGISGLNTLITTALPMAIANGFNPEAKNPADGQTYKFIVVSPQAPYDMHWSYGYNAIQYILPDVISRYRVDTTRIYVTGLSAGGSGTYSTVTNGPAFARKIAAIVPICAAGTNTQSEFDQIPLIGGTYGVKVWTPCGANDSWLSFAQNTVNTINSATPAPLVPAVVTAIPGVGHEPAAWNTVYDSSWRTNQHNLNVYEWMLQYNRPVSTPVAAAGPDQIISLPLDHVTLSGSGSSSNGIMQYAWTKTSGPASGTLVTPSAATTEITGLTQGSYVFRLTVTDSSNVTATDELTVTVNAMANTPPAANAGSDLTLTLPTDSTILNGSGTDADGSISSYKWKAIAGPAQYNLVDSTMAVTAVKNLVQGTYLFQLTVTDNSGAIAKDTVSVLVNAAANQAPLANAGPDQTITLPQDSIWLNGSGTDADGTIASYQWQKLSGSGGNISNAGTAQTSVSGLVAGSYQFRLTVTDNNGATGSDTMNLVVNPAPVVSSCNGVKRYMIPADDGGRYINSVPGSGWYQEVNPGDTLVLKSQYPWSYFSMEGYSGTPACPIVVTNEGGQVWLTSGISANNCKYLKITGSGAPSTYYGFKVYNPAVDQNGVAVCITGKARVIEVDRVDVYKKTYGVWAKQDPLCDTSYNYPNFIMDSIEIHHSRFKNIGQDCIYAGNTDPLGTRTYYCDGVPQNFIPMRLSNINIHHLIIDSCNRTGIQLGGANSGYNQIHDNLVTRCGFEYNQWQGTGIAIGGMTRNCHVYNNTIRNTFLYGIMSFGVGINYIENNIVDSTGYLNGQPNLGSHPTNILASPKETIPFDSTTIIIRNNKLGVNSTVEDYNIQVVTWGPATWTVNNIVCGNTKLNGTTPANVYVDPTVTYQNNCGTGSNQLPPLVNAGTDISLTPPYDSAMLSGTATDADGTVISYRWTLVSGPAACIISQPAQAQTSVTGLLPGTYVFRLTVMDNDSLSSTDDVAVSIPAANLPPLANAGPNKWLTLPVNYITMSAGGYDQDGTITSYQWSLVSGPSIYNMTSSTDPLTSVTGLAEGIYKFELSVTDNSGASARDTMVIYVNPASSTPANIAPVANAGPDGSITLPSNTCQLNGSGTDADGSVVIYQWAKISGPSGGQLTNPGQPQTTVSGLEQGTYRFELIVTDNLGAAGRDTMTLIVNAAPNQPPVIQAGTDQVIFLPLDSVLLSGSGSDADGAVVAYQWKKIAGPSSYTIVDPATEQTLVRNLVSGIYLFELSGTDNSAATAKDTLKITVYPASSGTNSAPLVSAGTDQSITLPLNSVTLSGMASDADGSIVSWQWSAVSGPTSFTIVSSMQAQTLVNNLAEGIYEFELTVTDNGGASSRDTVRITVNAPVNLPPVVNAGPDQTITLPLNSVSLTGSGSDPDGTITSWQWRRIGGPVFYSFDNSTSPVTTVSGMMQGTYTFELRATDNLGAIARDTVEIIVKQAPNNKRPVAKAGSNLIIALPDNSVQLNGTGTDEDGTVVSYNWTKLSGPSNYFIQSPSQPQTRISNLAEGEYSFELKVTDNLGAVGTDTVTIVVTPGMQANSNASIYPNPGTSTLNVRIDAVTHRNQTSLKIYDARGALVYEEEFLRTQQVVMKQVDVSGFKKGIYWVMVGVDINRDITLKFIKQ